MELKLIETRRVKDIELKVYEIGRYIVRDATYESGYRHIEVRVERDDYLPSIYCRTNLEGDTVGFEVQTTSYGALEVDELRKMIAALEEAAQVAEILAVTFVNR